MNLAPGKTTLCRAYPACGLARMLGVAAVWVLHLALCGGAAFAEVSASVIGRALLAAYPDFLERIDGNELVWKDGTRMPIEDHARPKTADELLATPSIRDMFLQAYPAGEKGAPPKADPGRVRYMPLFKKMYGDCQKNEVADRLVEVIWLPTRSGSRLKFSRINGAAAALQRVSNELDKLPPSFLQYLIPAQGTYNCRPIAGTDRLSAHGLGIAIDIARAGSDYWFWSKQKPNGQIPYKNRIPWEIVLIFEKHGFIWGGKWHHYDTMHFEYRPELILVER